VREGLWNPNRKNRTGFLVSKTPLRNEEKIRFKERIDGEKKQIVVPSGKLT